MTVVDLVAREIHKSWRCWVKDLTKESHSLERKIRNKWLLKDKDYELLTLEEKEEFRETAEKIISMIRVLNKS